MVGDRSYIKWFRSYLTQRGGPQNPSGLNSIKKKVSTPWGRGCPQAAFLPVHTKRLSDGILNFCFIFMLNFWLRTHPYIICGRNRFCGYQVKPSLKKVSPLSIYNCISFPESTADPTRIQGTRLNGNQVASLTGHAIIVFYVVRVHEDLCVALDKSISADCGNEITSCSVPD